MCAWKYAYLPKRGVYEGILGKAEAWNGPLLSSDKNGLFFFSFCTVKASRMWGRAKTLLLWSEYQIENCICSHALPKGACLKN